METNINKLTLLVDKYDNLIYTYIENKYNEIKAILFINKFIYNIINISKKFLNRKNSYKNFINQFNNILIKLIKLLDVTNHISIIVHKIRYPSYIKDNKLIIRLGNIKNIIIYLSDTNKSNINISEKGNIININSKNLHYMTNLALLIKNCKKLDLCTGIGMSYEKEKIIFKKKNRNAIKK